MISIFIKYIQLYMSVYYRHLLTEPVYVPRYYLIEYFILLFLKNNKIRLKFFEFEVKGNLQYGKTECTSAYSNDIVIDSGNNKFVSLSEVSTRVFSTITESARNSSG